MQHHEFFSFRISTGWIVKGNSQGASLKVSGEALYNHVNYMYLPQKYRQR